MRTIKRIHLAEIFGMVVLLLSSLPSDRALTLAPGARAAEPSSWLPAERSSAHPAATPQVVSMELVDQIGGSSRAVAVQGDYLYVGLDPRLVILTSPSPNNLVLVGRTDLLAGIVEDVAVRDG